jgi:predicted nicotinamide N-methyase
VTPAEFISANTTVRSAPLVPEIRLHLADEVFHLWEMVEAGLGRVEPPLPFWGFAWAGGQALARYLLDCPEAVRGQSVLDVASGSGLVAIAAALAGARFVTATDLDPYAVAAVALNADLNGVTIDTCVADVARADAAGAEIVLAGDVLYEQSLADLMLRFFGRAQAAGATVLVGDPDRAYLPRERFEAVARYAVPGSKGLEQADLTPATVWRLR